MRTSLEVEIVSTVRNGFPVRVAGTVCPAEPDVGLMSAYVQDSEVMTMRGQSVEWLKLTDDEIYFLELELLAAGRSMWKDMVEEW